MGQKTTNPYTRMEGLCLQLDAKHELRQLLEEGDDFAQSQSEVHDLIEKFHDKLQTISFCSLVLLWAKRLGKDRAVGAIHINMLGDLFEAGIFPPKQPTLAPSDIAHLNHDLVISRIRSNNKWFLKDRERYVSFYVMFINAMSEMTFGLIPTIADQDRLAAARRKLPFETYVDLLSLLPDRERILTKLFYLGGERSLEEILSLEVKQIDFKANHIHFSDHAVCYPKHVLGDIKAHLGDRKKGPIFVGKQGEKINHTVPYRALKSAAQKLNLPDTFTFKDLIKEL